MNNISNVQMCKSTENLQGSQDVGDPHDNQSGYEHEAYFFSNNITLNMSILH